MVQGLSTSSPLYTLLPRHLQERVAHVVPSAGVLIPQPLLDLYRKAPNQGSEVPSHLTHDRIRTRAWGMESVIKDTPIECLTQRQYHQLQELMNEGTTNSERLMLLDWMAMWKGAREGKPAIANIGPSFFVDDSRLTTSSQDAALAATAATSDYAVATGVVFETKKDSKSTVLVTPPREQHPQLQQALQGTLLGGAPEVVRSTKFLGVNESTEHLPSIAVLKQIERLGSLAAMQVTRTAHRLKWPVAARKIYMERAQTKVINLLPLAAPAPMAGARLNSLQGRWAHQVMKGRAYYHEDRLTRSQIQRIREDLGWVPLWQTTKAHTIMLYQRMRNEPEEQPHTIWARQDPPPKGTWVAYARSLQNRLQVPDLVVQAKDQPPLGKAARKAAVHRYADHVVWPAVRGGDDATHRSQGLPWVWLHTCIKGREEVNTFEEWWAWRSKGKTPRQLCAGCHMCLADVVCDMRHITECCQPAAVIARCYDQDIREVFEVPTTPDRFRAILDITGSLLALWDMNHTKSGPRSHR